MVGKEMSLCGTFSRKCVAPAMSKLSSHLQVRSYQKPPERPGLLRRFIDNLKEGLKGDKALQENLKQFQEEAKKV